AVEMATAASADTAAVDIVPGANPSAPPDAGGNRWRCSGFEIELHRTEAEGYYLNITAPDPRIFVMWRFFDDGVIPPARPVLVTVSYNQAGRFMDGGETVDGVPMLPAIAGWMREFVAVTSQPEPRRKVKRNDPVGDEALRRDRDRRSE